MTPGRRLLGTFLTIFFFFWLLINLLYPFIVVLIHTYMDTLTNDEDREINHHGNSIQINIDSHDNEEAGSG